MPERLLYAITGHGYGHAVRSLAIASEVVRRCPQAEITYSTTVPRSLLEHAGAGLAARLRCQEYEPGTLERICFEVDVEATRTAYACFAAEREFRIAEEARYLRQGGFSGVISDIAAVPIAAAARVGIPAVAVSNFTWDWILEPLLEGAPDLRGLPAVLGEDYRGAAAYLRLPFHPEEHPFRRVLDLPLVGRRAMLERKEARCRLRLGSRPVVLVTIGGFAAQGWPRIRVEGCSDLEFLVVGDLPLGFPAGKGRFLPGELPDGLGFVDLVAASDAVLAKPGYGISSDCAANGTPLVGVERKGFREYQTLREGLARLVPYREVALSDFLAGQWSGSISSALAAGRGVPDPAVGALAAAERIAEILGLGCGLDESTAPPSSIR